MRNRSIILVRSKRRPSLPSFITVQRPSEWHTVAAPVDHGQYDMQRTWRDDETKCTFIVLARHLLNEQDLEQMIKSNNKADGMDFIQQSLSAMVGDVNLFLSDEEEADEEDDRVQNVIEMGQGYWQRGCPSHVVVRRNSFGHSSFLLQNFRRQ